MAQIDITMTATGDEPKTCTRKFCRGEHMIGLVYSNGDSAGWHTQECVNYWQKEGRPKCLVGD